MGTQAHLVGDDEPAVEPEHIPELLQGGRGREDGRRSEARGMVKEGRIPCGSLPYPMGRLRCLSPGDARESWVALCDPYRQRLNIAICDFVRVHPQTILELVEENLSGSGFPIRMNSEDVKSVLEEDNEGR